MDVKKKEKKGEDGYDYSRKCEFDLIICYERAIYNERLILILSIGFCWIAKVIHDYSSYARCIINKNRNHRTICEIKM